MLRVARKNVLELKLSPTTTTLKLNSTTRTRARHGHGPERTRTDPTEFRRKKVPVRDRVRVVEFSYYLAKFQPLLSATST